MGSGASSPEMLENPQVLEDPQMCFAVKYLGPPRGSLQTGAVGWVRNERVTFHNVGSLDGLVATQFMPFRRVISTTCQENVAKGEMGMVVAMEGANLLVEFQKSKKRFIIPDHVSYYAIVPGSFSVYRYTGPEKKGRVDTIRPGDLGFAKEGTDKLQIWGHQATWSASELEIQKVVPAHFAQCPSGHAYSPVKFENGWRCSSGPNCCLLQRGDAQAACRFRCSTCNLDLCNRCYEAMALPGVDSQRLQVFCLDPILWTDPNRAKASPDKAEAAEAAEAGSSSKEAKAEAAQAEDVAGEGADDSLMATEAPLDEAEASGSSSQDAKAKAAEVDVRKEEATEPDIEMAEWFQPWKESVFDAIKSYKRDGATGIVLLGVVPGPGCSPCPEWNVMQNRLREASEKQMHPFYDKGEMTISFDMITFRAVELDDLGEELAYATRKGKYALIISCPPKKASEALGAVKLHNVSRQQNPELAKNGKAFAACGDEWLMAPVEADAAPGGGFGAAVEKFCKAKDGKEEPQDPAESEKVFNIREQEWFNPWEQKTFAKVQDAFDDGASGVTIIGIKPGMERKMTTQEWPAFIEDVTKAYHAKAFPFFENGKEIIPFNKVRTLQVDIEELGEELVHNTRKNKYAIIASACEDHFPAVRECVQAHNKRMKEGDEELKGHGPVRRSYGTANDWQQ